MHVIERIQERYGVELDYSDVKRLERDAAETGMVIRLMPNGMKVMAVKYGDIVMRLVFADCGRAITALPADDFSTKSQRGDRIDGKRHKAHARRRRRERRERRGWR